MSAADWIGPSDPPRDHLNLTKIGVGLPDAAELKMILSDPKVTGTDARRRRSSDEAASAQRWFKRLGVAVVVGSAVAALASGLLLYGSGSGDAPADSVQQGLVGWVRRNMTAITAVQVIGLFAATAAAAVLAARDYGRIWTEARRKAESDRIGLLEAIMDLAAEAPGTGPGGRLRQALEFFRRYQLDLQIGFYTRRADQFTASDTRTIWAAAALAGIAAVTGTLGALGHSFTVLAAFLGIAVPVLLSATRSWRTINQNAEKAASYAAARDALEAIRQDLRKAQASADQGDIEAVRHYVARVHEVMRVENGAWRGAGEISAVPAVKSQSAPNSSADGARKREPVS
jgi:hypothetical protein